MKTTLNLSGAAFLLAISLLPAAAAQVNDIPAEIDVTTTLNCGTNFLSVPGVYNLLISGISLTGDAAGYDDVPYPPWNILFPAPGLEGSTHASLTAPGRASVLAKLRVCAALLPEFIRYRPDLNQIYAGYDGYNLNGSLSLQNGETYYLSPFRTGWPDPDYYMSGDVNPLGPDPGYFDEPNQNPVGINSTAYSETPGILSITLKCPDGSPAPAGIQGGNIVATLNDSDKVQAVLPSFDPSSGAIHLLVRSGHNYSLSLSYTTGSGSDLISWPINIPNVPSNSTDTVPGCGITPVVATMLTCDIANPLPCGGSTIIGFIDMLGDEVNWPDNFSMNALPGPAGNSRSGMINPVLPAPVDYFEIIHIVPSDFFVPYGYPDQPYSVGGQLCFGMNSDYEYFQPSHLSVEVADCHLSNLGQTFRMCPGHVQGNISLSGPDYGNSQTSPWQSLILDRTFAGNGHDDADPYLAVLPVTGTSFIGANQVDGDGAARVLFSAQTVAGGSTLSGKYDLRLAGLSSIDGDPSTSIWTSNQLTLNFHSSSTAPEDNIQENLQIVDNTYTGVEIDCGVTNLHDIDYCFGEVLIKIVDTNPGDNSYLKVSVSGDIDPASGSSFSAHFSAVGVVVPPPSPTGHANGLIRLFLPKGTYKYVTTVDTATSSYNQPASTFAASCRGITPVTPGGPVFSVDIPPCSIDSNVIATVTVDLPVTNYTVNYTIGQETFPGIDCEGCGAQNNIFGVPLHPCLNEIIFTVSNNITHEVSSVTEGVTYSQAPLITSCGDIVLQMPAGQDSVTVDYDKYPNISIVGGCDPKTISFNPPNLSSFPVGSTPVTCGVADFCNSNFCTFNVVVQPPPCIVFTNESFTCNTNGSGYSYNFTAINTQPDPIYYLQAFGNSGSCLSITPPIFIFPSPLGEPDENEQSGSFIVSVDPACNQQQVCLTIEAHGQSGEILCSVDRCFTNPALPTIDCPTNIVVDCTNDSGAYVDFALPTGSGHCCALVSVTAYPPPGNFPIGVTPVTFTAIDACGHSNSCQFSVTVRGHSSSTDQPRNLRHDGFSGDIQVANAIAVDDDGNSFITGWFSGTAHFGSISLTSSGGTDIFLAKFGPDLSGPLWVQNAGGGGNDLGDAVAVDSQGNCYIAGTIDAGPFAVDFLKIPANSFGPGQTIRLDGPANMFLAKYDRDGTLLWVAPANGQSGGSAEGVAIDSNDDCYLCGGFGSVGIFYSGTGGVGAARSRVGSGQSDAYLAKYSSAGDPQWIISSSGSSPYFADARSVAIDRCNDKAFIAGTFVGTPAFGNLALEPSGVGFGRVFVAQCALSPASPPSWTWVRQTFRPPSTNNYSHDARQIGVDCAGNCYFTAYFNGSASIGADNKTAQFTRSPSLANPYPHNEYLVGSFDPNGTPLWLYAGSTSGDDESRAIAVRPDTGDVFVAGFLNGLDEHADGGRFVNLLRFDELGALKATHLASGTSHFQSNAGRGLAIDAAGCLYMTGSYTDTNLNFQDFQNVLPASHVLSSTDGNPKTFVAKYCPFCEDCIVPGFTTYPKSVASRSAPSVSNPVSFTAVTSGSLPMYFFWHNGNTVLNPGGGAISTSCYSVTVDGYSSTLTLTCPETGPFYVVLTNNCPFLAVIASPPVGYGYFDVDRLYYSGVANVPLNINMSSNLPFAIQYRDDLRAGGLWLDLTNGSGTGNPIQIVDPNPNPTNRFYRLSIPANLP